MPSFTISYASTFVYTVKVPVPRIGAPVKAWIEQKQFYISKTIIPVAGGKLALSYNPPSLTAYVSSVTYVNESGKIYARVVVAVSFSLLYTCSWLKTPSQTGTYTVQIYDQLYYYVKVSSGKTSIGFSDRVNFVDPKITLVGIRVEVTDISLTRYEREEKPDQYYFNYYPLYNVQGYVEFTGGGLTGTSVVEITVSLGTSTKTEKVPASGGRVDFSFQDLQASPGNNTLMVTVKIPQPEGAVMVRYNKSIMLPGVKLTVLWSQPIVYGFQDENGNYYYFKLDFMATLVGVAGEPHTAGIRAQALGEYLDCKPVEVQLNSTQNSVLVRCEGGFNQKPSSMIMYIYLDGSTLYSASMNTRFKDPVLVLDRIRGIFTAVESILIYGLFASIILLLVVHILTHIGLGREPIPFDYVKNAVVFMVFALFIYEVVTLSIPQITYAGLREIPGIGQYIHPPQGRTGAEVFSSSLSNLVDFFASIQSDINNYFSMLNLFFGSVVIVLVGVAVALTVVAVTMSAWFGAGVPMSGIIGLITGLALTLLSFWLFMFVGAIVLYVVAMIVEVLVAFTVLALALSIVLGVFFSIMPTPAFHQWGARLLSAGFMGLLTLPIVSMFILGLYKYIVVQINQMTVPLGIGLLLSKIAPVSPEIGNINVPVGGIAFLFAYPVVLGVMLGIVLAVLMRILENSGFMSGMFTGLRGALFM